MLWPVKGGQTRFTNTSPVPLLMIDHWLFLFAALYYMIQHFRSRRAMTGQGINSLMGRWGVKLFFCKATFCWFMDNDMFLFLLLLDIWRARGEFVRLWLLKRSIQEFIHAWIHLLLQTLHQSLHSLFIEQSLKCFEMKLSTVLPLPKGERACVPLSKCEAVSLGTR